jgi:peptidylamidoglycolate lyase
MILPGTKKPSWVTRRQFLKRCSAAGFAAQVGSLSFAEALPVLGQGDFRYRMVPNWGLLGPKTPVNNCHGIVCDREGHIVLLTDHTSNNVIIYDRKGRLVHQWGHDFPGAHGLSIVSEAHREVLFITDLKTHRIVKTTLDGELLDEWRWPEQSGKYNLATEFRPSWTLHLPSGDFFVLDGYGRDYISHYGSDGKFLKVFGGAEGGIPHWGPHGGMIDAVAGEQPSLLIAMSDRQHLLRLSLNGEHLARIALPGGNPRQIRKYGNHYFLAHLGDNWPNDRNSRGFISVLDENLRVVSNIGGTAPIYAESGSLLPMAHQGDTFMHPHDVTTDPEGSLYVAQFASGNTYPIKLERV